MLKITNTKNNIFIIEIEEPKKEQDEKEFITFLNTIFECEQFGLVLHVQGKKFFSMEAKKDLNSFFKKNKQKLKNQCVGFARINQDASKIARFKGKALRLAMPCHYGVFNTKSEGINWINSKKILKES